MRKLLLAAIFCIAANASAAISGADLFEGKPVEVKPGAKGTVALFLSARCPCSNSHVALLKKLVKDFPAFSFVVIHSNADEPLPEARDYFRKSGLDLPVIQDDHDKLADELKALKTPHAYVIAADGKILYRGGVTNSQNGEAATEQPLRAALEDVTAGRAVKASVTRTLGCVIAR